MKSGTMKSGGISLGYWCFHPGLALQRLIRAGARCAILTSGTLSPLQSMAQVKNYDVQFFVRKVNITVSGI